MRPERLQHLLRPLQLSSHHRSSQQARKPSVSQLRAQGLPVDNNSAHPTGGRLHVWRLVMMPLCMCVCVRECIFMYIAIETVQRTLVDSVYFVVCCTPDLEKESNVR